MNNVPLRTVSRAAALTLAAALAAGCAQAPVAPPTVAASSAAAPVPAGEVKGRAWQHTPETGAAAMNGAQLALPASPGAPAYFGRASGAAATAGVRWPVVVFLHGSSGLGLAAIGEWQRWLAQHGIASVAPDSFALPDRLTYKSPVGKEVYERIHALRAQEIDLALSAVKAAPFFDASRVVVAGTSEGAVAVARHGGAGVAGRMLFAWSCEDNYMVQAHRTAVPPSEPVLNIISSTDPYFSQANAFLGAPKAVGHCGPALAAHKAATVVLIPGAPHTLLNLPAARHATLGFLRDLFKL